MQKGQMCGGITPDIKPADERIATVVATVKDDFVAKSGVTCEQFKPVHYKTQVVAGTNYFVKVDLGGEKYAHLRIYEPLPHTKQAPQLHSFQTGKGLGDAVEYF